MEEEYMTAQDAARACNLNVATVVNWVATGKIPHTAGKEMHAGRRRRMVKVADVRARAARMGTPPLDAARQCGVVMSTGEIARMCHVAPRTAAKWLDSGEIAGSFRLPGSRDRRAPTSSVMRFLRKNNFPTAAMSYSRRCVLMGPCATPLAGPFRSALHDPLVFNTVPAAVGVLASGGADAAILCASLGGSLVEDTVACLVGLPGNPFVAVLANDDDPEGRYPNASAVYRAPINPAEIADAVTAHFTRLF